MLACRALLFCLSACYQSMSLSPFTFPPVSDVIPVFHFIPASCSSLINKQMTSPVCVFLFECQMTCTYPFLPTTGSLWVGFPLSFASRRHVWIHLVVWTQPHCNIINIIIAVLLLSACFWLEGWGVALFRSQLLLGVVLAELIGSYKAFMCLRCVLQTVSIHVKPKCAVTVHTLSEMICSLLLYRATHTRLLPACHAVVFFYVGGQ